jgi:chromosome segregation ATPase
LDALPIVEDTISTAKQLQQRLPLCLAEMDSVQESIRLTERKLLICEKMITEAEAESDRCEKGIQSITRMLEQDDEDMLMVEDERRGYKRELSILEIEYSQWANNFDTRIKEKLDIKDGLSMMYKFQRDRIKEKEDVKSKLEENRSDLPPCINILRNLSEAVFVASALNTTLVSFKNFLL